jgi:hypothetical protein
MDGELFIREMWASMSPRTPGLLFQRCPMIQRSLRGMGEQAAASIAEVFAGYRPTWAVNNPVNARTLSA